MKTLTVLSPVYNEEEGIETFYRELSGILADVQHSYASMILFVVDRSEDRTLDRLREIACYDPAVRILALSSRFGHQMSLLAGIDHCDTDVLIMMDSDLQHPPALIPTLLAEYEKGYDVVYTLRHDTQDVGWFKRVTSQAFYRFINRISAVPINESAADFRLLSRRVVRVFQTQIRERNQFLRGLVGWVGFPSTAVPFEVGVRQAGKSKYSLLRLVRFGIDGVVSFSKVPLMAAIAVGLAFAAFGFLLAGITFVQYLVNQNLPPGWATLTVLLSVFGGIQLFFLGIIGVYIGAIFDEVKARPHYLVQERINFGPEQRSLEQW